MNKKTRWKQFSFTFTFTPFKWFNLPSQRKRFKIQRLPGAAPKLLKLPPHRNSPSGHSIIFVLRQFSSSLASLQSGSPVFYSLFVRLNPISDSAGTNYNIVNALRRAIIRFSDSKTIIVHYFLLYSPSHLKDADMQFESRHCHSSLLQLYLVWRKFIECICFAITKDDHLKI